MTAVQRGTTNTRWRDYVDIYLLSRAHAVSGRELDESLARVSEVRGVQRRSLSSATTGYAALAQAKWAPWVRKQGLHHRVSTNFAPLLEQVALFADPILEGRSTEFTWQPTLGRWA
jgi:hypothetical protein